MLLLEALTEFDEALEWQVASDDPLLDPEPRVEWPAEPVPGQEQ